MIQADPSHPKEEAPFSILDLGSCSFGDDPHLMTIIELWNIHRRATKLIMTPFGSTLSLSWTGATLVALNVCPLAHPVIICHHQETKLKYLELLQSQPTSPESKGSLPHFSGWEKSSQTYRRWLSHPAGNRPNTRWRSRLKDTSRITSSATNKSTRP